MIRALRQKHLDITDHTKGDCFKTCVAMILDLPQDDVPNFCAAPKDEWWQLFQKWLEALHLTAIEVDIAKHPLCCVTRGTPCIVTGKSPRGSWLHSVVAEAMDEQGFEYLHDPHPSDAGLEDVQLITFFASLRPDRARKSHDHPTPTAVPA